jgi:hypothetical protein
MKRLFARSRSLLLVAALAMVAATGTVSTAAHAAPADTGGAAGVRTAIASRSTAASSTPCTFGPAQSCESTDPAVTVNTYYYGDTSGCTFTWDIGWGDGSSSADIVISQPADGYVFTANHTYAAPGEYTIAVTGTEDGSCQETNGDFTFTLASSLATPSNLAVTAVDPHDIRLNWQYNPGDQTGFEINNGVVSKYTGPDSRTYTWGGLAPGTYMCFKIRAYNSAGDSAWDPDASPWYVCTTTPKSATAPRACPTVLLGVHGFGEGPSTTDAVRSGTLESTWKYFRQSSAARAHGSKAYIIEDISYPTTGFLELDNPIKLRTIVSDVTDGSFALEAAVQHFTALCHSTAFELVGYSEGAWIIDYWLHFNQSEARSHVKAIELYGDPNWYKAYGHDVFGFVAAYQGLSRIAGLTYGWYGPPYPNPNTPYAVQTVCLPKDPVCGRGYIDTVAEHAVQFAAAAVCVPTHCSHLNYTSGATKQGGEFLADHAF